jgi:glycosyltransferase involved in cell wall biosynthesis
MTALSQMRHETVASHLHIAVMNSAPEMSDLLDFSERDIVVDELQTRQRHFRLAIVTETYPPEVNGVALTIAKFVEGMRNRGHDVQLIRPRQMRDEFALNGEVLMRGLPIPRYPHLKMGLPAKNALAKLWSHRRPDLVHIVTEGPLGWSALGAAQKLKLPVTSDFRTNFHAYSGHYGIGWLQKPIFAYLRKFHNRTHCTMVPTESLRQGLAEMGFQRLRVVARGVDTKLFNPAKRSDALRAQWGVSPDAPDTPVVLYVGRIAAEKNLATLVRAYRAMREADPRCKLVLVGEGPQRRELESQIPEAIFVGLKRDEDLAAHYASGDVFLFPSMTETFGNVVPEAMASGLSVLAYRYAAAAQLVEDGVSGRTVELGNTNAFVQGAADLMRDWNATQGYRTAARRVTEAHDWDRLVRELETVFDDAITIHQSLPHAGAHGQLNVSDAARAGLA